MDRKPLTLHRLRELYAAGEKLTMLTCYDATFAQVLVEKPPPAAQPDEVQIAQLAGHAGVH